MTAKKPSSRKAPARRPARTKAASAAKPVPATRTRARKSTAGRSKAKTAKSESVFSSIGSWMHDTGQKIKSAEKKVVRKVKTKLRRILHLRPQTA